MTRQAYALVGKTWRVKNPDAAKLLEIGGVLFMLFLVVIGLSGCREPATKEMLAAAYTAELAECVRVSPTLAASKSCRHAVDCHWGVLTGAECP